MTISEIDMNVIRKFGKRVYKWNKANVARFTLLDRGWKQTMYLKGEKEEQMARTAKAEFKMPHPPF